MYSEHDHHSVEQVSKAESRSSRRDPADAPSENFLAEFESPSCERVNDKDNLDEFLGDSETSLVERSW